MEKYKEYPEIKDPNGDSKMKLLDNKDSGVDVPRFVSDFEKVNRKFGKLKCQCPEA